MSHAATTIQSNIARCASLFIGCVLASTAFGAAFTPGNVVVYRVGAGTGVLANTGNPVFVDEFSPSGSLVQSIALPTSASGAQSALIASGTAGSEGLITRSADGNCVLLTGYGPTAAVSTSISGTTSATVPRVVGRIDAAGVVDTSTILNNVASGNNVRGVTGTDCNNVWITGGAGGITYATIGSTSASGSLSATVANLRGVSIATGQLYISTASGSTVRVGSVGTGLPTTAGQTITNLPGFATAGSPYAFFFADLSTAVPGVDTLYVADDTSGATGGITKYSLVGGNWVSSGTIVGTTSDAYRGLTGVVSGATVTLYATRKGGSGAAGGGELVSLTDSAGYNAALTGTPAIIATAATNTAFRGVAMAPGAATTTPTVTISFSANTGTEAGVTQITISATSSAPLATAQTVDVIVSGTGVTAGDYTLGNTTLTIPAGQSIASTTFAIVDDADTEGPETANVTLTNPSAGIALGATISGTIAITDNDTANTAPTISAIPALAAVNGLLDNPSVTFSIADAETPASGLTLSVISSSNPTVVPTSAVTFVSTNGAVTASVAPAGIGFADVLIRVSDGVFSADATLKIAASATPIQPSSTRYYFGACDASTAVAVDSNAMFIADDEGQMLRLYNRNQSGYPLYSVDYSNLLNLTDISGGAPREVDLEASTRIGNRIYWLGSHSNASSGNTRVNRSRLFATDISGSGVGATLSFVGYYTGLKSDLITWDANNAHGLGANYFGFTASTASGVAPEIATGAGFNIEGLTVAPDGATAWLAFRAPIAPASARTKALIVPVTNFASLVGGAPAAGPATFGTPIELDLGGRGIRSIERAADGQYVIIAGPHDVATGTAPKDFRLYRWSGIATQAPQITSAVLAGLTSTGSPEAIVDLPSAITPVAQIPLVADSGDAIWYGGSTICKDLTENRFKAFRADSIALGSSAYRIHTVQGSGPTSPLVGQTVTIEGIVTADFQGANQLGGFYLQEPDALADSDLATSEGIFVFNTSTTVAVGDLVRVSGPVVEFSSGSGTSTQIAGSAANPLSISVLSSGNALPTVIDVSLPISNLSDWERYESMRVRFQQTLTVTENFNLAQFGELVLADTRQVQPTNVIDPNDASPAGNTTFGNSNVSAITAAQQTIARSRIILDDGSTRQNPATLPYWDSVNNTLRVGTTTSGVTGILTFAFSQYRIQPTEAPSFNFATRPATPPNVGAANVKVASFNVLNYFNGNGTGGGFADVDSNQRGASTSAEFVRQKAKIVSAINTMNADVVGLMEMENDGSGALSAIADLVSGLNAAAGAGTWAYLNDPANLGATAGGTDAIKVSIIYKPAAVVIDRATLLCDAPAFSNGRTPTGQTFRSVANNGRFTLVVNHFKSKSTSRAPTGADVDQNDGQAAYNASRRDQATALNACIATWKNTVGDYDFILLGDFNAYAQEDPMDVLRTAGNVVLDESGYSYVFDGQSGSLDHAVVSPSLLPQVTGSSVWHINADEPRILDYNFDFKNTVGCTTSTCTSPDFYTPTLYRSSDHDPVLIGLNISAVNLPFDIDGSGSCDAVNDPLLLMRYLMGFRDDALIAGLTIAPTARTLAQIIAHLAGLDGAVDVDDDGQNLAHTDALMFSRYTQSLTGPALTTGARNARQGGGIKSDADIKRYLDDRCGVTK